MVMSPGRVICVLTFAAGSQFDNDEACDAVSAEPSVVVVLGAEHVVLDGLLAELLAVEDMAHLWRGEKEKVAQVGKMLAKHKEMWK